jgi:hypothetical protein
MPRESRELCTTKNVCLSLSLSWFPISPVKEPEIIITSCDAATFWGSKSHTAFDAGPPAFLSRKSKCLLFLGLNGAGEMYMSMCPDQGTMRA